MPGHRLSQRPARRWRTATLAVLSLADDVAIAAFAHARWAAGRAVVLGPKGILLGGVLGLAAGAAWCTLARSGRRRKRPAAPILQR